MRVWVKVRVVARRRDSWLLDLRDLEGLEDLEDVEYQTKWSSSVADLFSRA